MFLSAAQSAFSNRLVASISKSLPALPPTYVLGIGATDIRRVFTADQVPLVVHAYVEGLKSIWAITIGALGIATIIGCFGSWKKLHGPGAAEEVKPSTEGVAAVAENVTA